jgi:hypothetical protein
MEMPVNCLSLLEILLLIFVLHPSLNNEKTKAELLRKCSFHKSRARHAMLHVNKEALQVFTLYVLRCSNIYCVRIKILTLGLACLRVSKLEINSEILDRSGIPSVVYLCQNFSALDRRTVACYESSITRVRSNTTL